MKRTLALALVSAAALIFSAAALTSTVRADGPYQGSWRAGPMRIDVAVESWGGDCGPRPQSTTVPGGAAIAVTQNGDDLTFAGRPPRTTRGCWSENTAVRRVSSSYQSGTWRVTCRTPDDDPRGETGTYTLHAASPERIEFRDQSRYDWQLNTSHCTASITATQTFERVGGATPTPVAETPRPPENPPEPACTPGAPVRVSMRPASADLEPGGRACFTARVVDANGCAVPGQSAQMELRAPAGATAQLRGNCFEAAASAAEGEGEFAIVATAGALTGTATVRVRTADLSDLIARRAEGGGAVTVNDDDGATSEEAARVAARGETTRPSLVLPIVLSVLGLFIALAAGVGLFLRGQKKSARKPASDVAEAPMNDTLASPPPVAATAEQKICPVCRRGHPPSATTCVADGTPLVAYADFAAGRVASAAGKTCPTCGSHYPATTRFCGKDGTVLG